MTTKKKGSIKPAEACDPTGVSSFDLANKPNPLAQRLNSEKTYLAGRLRGVNKAISALKEHPQLEEAFNAMRSM